MQFSLCENFKVFLAQNLREIDLGDSKSEKCTVFTHLEALDFDFVNFWHILKADIFQSNKIQRP